MANTPWLPTSRSARNALVKRTTTFMSNSTNRTRIGFASVTPNGVWYDTVYTSKLLIYNTEYGLWLNPATSTPLVLDDLKDAENAFFPGVSRFLRYGKSSPLVTNADLEGMGFPPRPDIIRSTKCLSTSTLYLVARIY